MLCTGICKTVVELATRQYQVTRLRESVHNVGSRGRNFIGQVWLDPIFSGLYLGINNRILATISSVNYLVLGW